MTTWRNTIVVLVALSACSKAPVGDPPPPVRAACGGVDTMLVEGTIAGAPVKSVGVRRSWAWVNIGAGKHFDGEFDGGKVHLEWTEMAGHGETVRVTAASLTTDAGLATGAFRSGSLVFDELRETHESRVKASLTFANGRIDVCARRVD